MVGFEPRLASILGVTPAKQGEVVIRVMNYTDWTALERIRKEGDADTVKHRNNPAQFFVYTTLVAEINGNVVGYTQFSLTPDGILHSLAMRVDASHKGRGIGSALLEAKEIIAREAGAKMHFYAVDVNGEEVLTKILVKMGMHACQRHGNIMIYVKAFSDDAA